MNVLKLVADQVSIAIENAALYDQLQQHSEVLEEMVAARTAELREALVRAQEGERIKTQFVTDVSHELRTPLSNIQLYVELLQQSGVDRRAEYLDTLARETERLASLIEDLLSISRLDSGKTELSKAALDLNQLSESLVNDRARLFAERGLALIWEPGSGAAEVQADSQLLGQVIGNLLTNAMHYTPEGGRVRVRTQMEADGGWVSLSIEDTGLGIAEAEQAQLFSRFFRGAASREMGNPGTGLGLAICREIAERHGGRIEVESTAGEGSVFTLWLPVQPQAEAV